MKYESKKRRTASMLQSEHLSAIRSRITAIELELLRTPSSSREWSALLNHRNNLIALLPEPEMSKRDIQAWVDAHKYRF
jgi:hypothetical protein